MQSSTASVLEPVPQVAMTTVIPMTALARNAMKPYIVKWAWNWIYKPLFTLQHSQATSQYVKK